MRLLRSLLFFAVGFAATSASAQDFARDSIPNKWIEPLVPEDLPELEHPAYFNDFDKAKAEVFTGRYKLALQTLRHLKDADPAEVALLKGEAMSALGRESEAIKVLSDLPVANYPKCQVLQAQVLAKIGKPREALALLSAHLKAHPDSIDGHYWLGAINEQIGDLDAARAAYDWFVNDQKFPEKWSGGQHPAFENAVDVVTIGRAVDRWAALSGAYSQNRALHDLIMSMFVRSYDVIDRSYWPARVAAAEYFMSHNSSKEAMGELRMAFSSNENDERVLQLIGLISLETWDFDRADAVIVAMRQVNRESVAADILEARNLLLQRRPRDAEYPLDEVLQHQPDNIEALGLLAATHALQLRDEPMREILSKVDKLDPDNATAYVEVAEQLAAMRQYPRSAAMYKTAIERAPWWTAPRNGLGLLYTQSGDEDDAFTVLEAAYSLDPFNHRTTNYLKLLDDLRQFARHETEHFIVLYDKNVDPIIPGYFGEYLESIHKEICEVFQHEPAVKTLIEVFPTHEEFSVRTTGSPWIGTVGASTGRVIALVAPRKGAETMGTFNWAQVLRHEYVHTVTLSATDNRIAHWMTEGLAVLEERAPLRWEWVPMLYHAVTKDKLFTMENLTWGFVRPKRPTDRTLAYAQSFWICKYIQEKYGHDALLRMLKRFREGARQEQVFIEITGGSASQFNEEFKAWAKQQVAGWGYDEKTSKRYDELRKQAEELTKARQYPEALKLWQDIQALRPVDALPHIRLAGLYLTKEIDDPEKAIHHLDVLHKVELKDNRYAKRIARLLRDQNKLDDSIKYATESVYIDPYDLSAHELLADLHERAGNGDQAKREREAVTILKSLPKSSETKKAE